MCVSNFCPLGLQDTANPGELESNQGSVLNVGYMMVKSSAKSKEMINEWFDKQVANPNQWDQNIFNDLARRTNIEKKFQKLPKIVRGPLKYANKKRKKKVH